MGEYPTSSTTHLPSSVSVAWGRNRSLAVNRLPILTRDRLPILTLLSDEFGR